MEKYHSDPRYRSLLHKAVRRGNVDLVLTTSALLQSLGSKESRWYTGRAAILTFEECWPLGAELVFKRPYHSKVAALVKVTQAQKAKDAAGLGSMAYALSKEDRSVLTGSMAEKHIRIIANALERPDDFWDWIRSRAKTDNHNILLENATRIKKTGFPWEKAFCLAGAYLGIVEGIPDIKQSMPSDSPFPYWIALDHQTPQGRRVLRDIARDLHIQLPQLIWTFFYFEGAITNSSLPSKWWQMACDWRFRKVGLKPEEAHLLWEPAKIQVKEALADDSRQLHNDLYSWKLSNLEQVELLKKQVGLYINRFDGKKGDQLELF
jgi:hypothetical protein